MPSYNYKCSLCEEIFSVTRSITEPDPGYECEICKIAMTRLFSVGAIQFNGSGFYSKDK